MRLAVHRRPTPRGQNPARRFAIISARQLNPDCHRAAYAYLLATSHFGCGHLELGCFEENGKVRFFGVRNMALANASRFAGPTLYSMRLGNAQHTTLEFAGVCSTVCSELGTVARWVSPSECVRLSVNVQLIPMADRPRVVRHLTARYERMQAALASPSGSGDSAQGASLEQPGPVLPQPGVSLRL